MTLNHFQSMIFFAVVISFAFAFLTKHKFSERLKYALWTFFLFLLVAVAIGWLMYPLSR